MKRARHKNPESPLTIGGRIKPGLKAEIQRNYQRLVKRRESEARKLTRHVASELKAFDKVARRLLGRRDKALYQAIQTKHRLALEKDRLQLIGTRKNPESILARHRAAFARDVTKSIPGSRELRRYKRHLLSDLSSLFEPKGTATGKIIGMNVALDVLDFLPDLVILEDPTLVNFTPPYPLAEHHESSFGKFESFRFDSRVERDAGLLIHDISSEHRDNAWITHKAAIYEAVGSVGVNYTVPRTGTVSVDLLIQNLVNEHRLSLTDNFGMSEGYGQLTNSLLLDIVHPNNIIPFEMVMSDIELESDGDDIFQENNNKIDTRFSRWLNFRSTGSFVAGTEVQIFVGNKDRKYSILDDMDCRTDTRFSWFIRNIVVRTI